MFTKLSLVAAAVLVAACDPNSPYMIFEEPSFSQLEGVWVGREEITGAEDIGANVNLGDQDRGFSFPVTLHLREDQTFTLTTSGYSTSYDDEFARVCSGSFTRSGTNLQFFPARTCRALPLPSFTIGRTLGKAITLEASTGTSLFPTSGSIKVRFNLNR
jgi:hypothetical protein